MYIQENVFSEKVWKAKVRDILEAYQEKVVSAIKSGYDGVEENKWTFAGAFLYSLTVITTIGESRSLSFRGAHIFLNSLPPPPVHFNSAIRSNFLINFNHDIKRTNVATSASVIFAFAFANETQRMKREGKYQRERLKNVDNLLSAGYPRRTKHSALICALNARLMPTFLVVTDKSP